MQSISGRLPERGRKKGEMIDERKMTKQPLPAPTASAVGPCPSLIQISRKFTQHHRTTRPPESISNQPIPFSIDRDGHNFHAMFQYMFYTWVQNCTLIDSFFNKIMNVKHG